MKSSLLQVLLLGGALTLGGYTHAADSCRRLEPLRNEAKALVYKAQAAHFNGVDGYSYEQILSAIDRPCLRELPRTIRIHEEERQSAYYEPTEKVIYVNSKPLAKMSKEERSFLILHELLGASMLPDRNYQMTLQIMKLTKNDLNESSAILSTMRERSLTPALSGGSGTSVGGGGDSAAIRLKSDLLDHLSRLESTQAASYNDVSLRELTRIVLDCPLEFRHDLPSFETLIREDYFINGVIQPGAPGFKLALVKMLLMNVQRDWARRTGTPKVAELLLDSVSRAAKALPEGQLCQIPFFPYVNVSVH